MKTKSVLPLFCLIGVAGCCLWSCETVQKYSNIPEIHYKHLVFVDRTDDLGETFKNAVLTFSFIDGDGDLGVKPQDKPSDRVSKIHYTWYSKHSDNTYQPYKFPNDSINLSSEIPYNSVMDKSEAHNKVLKGTIEIELSTPIEPKGVDTMRVEFYIADRARNQSNIEYTPDFSLLNIPEEFLPTK